MARSLSEFLETILSSYIAARQTGEGGPFGKLHPLWSEFEGLTDALREAVPIRTRPQIQVKWGAGQGNWARVPWIALLNRNETTTTQRGVYCVFLFREDMTGVYLTFNQGVTALQKRHGVRQSREILRSRARRLVTFLSEPHPEFETSTGIDLRTDANLGRSYESSTVAHKFYNRGAIPSKGDIERDLEVVLTAYDRYMESELKREFAEGDGGAAHAPPNADVPDPTDVHSRTPDSFELAEATERVIGDIAARGFVYEPWQIAQFITAVRTKPFVILAGITGTGKSKLPLLIAETTGGVADLVPVRPDWTDSSEILGFTDLEGVFRPGALLEIAGTAMGEDDVHRTLIIDEMNLARVEYYLAEVLSRIEDRRPADRGGFESAPLVRTELRAEDDEWGFVRLPPNLILVGTVNMDESAYAFSRKVLDRAFTIELAEIDLQAGINSPARSSPSGGRSPYTRRYARCSAGGRLAENPGCEQSALPAVLDR